MTQLIRTISRRMLLLSHPYRMGLVTEEDIAAMWQMAKGQIQTLCTHDVGMELGKTIQAIPWQPVDGEHHGNVQQHHGGPGVAPQISLQSFMVDRSPLALLVSLVLVLHTVRAEDSGIQVRAYVLVGYQECQGGNCELQHEDHHSVHTLEQWTRLQLYAFVVYVQSRQSHWDGALQYADRDGEQE
ncbi:hypothetical protein CEXT_766041 [Caerostris extrusa]|uniref:Uncharacterized protein n=1 Tax=Caerostris extrusa TaxID=172846 RepID=A0AAV4N849_CAEEX|nr:hypothetical protein CEXT_766041 [Caerostris extrusa]